MTAPQASTPTREECIAAAGDVLAAARASRDEIYSREGALGVAKAAWTPGARSIQQLAEGYEALVQKARRTQERVA